MIMKRNVILAGTGFDSRLSIIRRHCKIGATAVLKREPDNPHDPNAIEVFIEVRRLFGLFDGGLEKIGYIKANTAKILAKLMDKGSSIQASVVNMYAPPDRNYPKVILELDY
jgi:hypothetical protein